MTIFSKVNIVLYHWNSTPNIAFLGKYVFSIHSNTNILHGYFIVLKDLKNWPNLTN